jgi:CubicO group peptidase (beta-lactamase class C family)
LHVEDGERRYELMSVTKSVVSLAVGALVDRKKLSLDQPIADFIPAWRGTPKEAIRVRHVLGHSSGLADERTTEKIYASPDFVQFAIDAEVKHPPGTSFFYSNRAVNLLARVVAQASGKPLDEWTRESLFAPLGISDFGWTKDKAGNPHVMSGLQMRSRDAAKLGQLVLDDGRLCGEQIVSGAWLEQSTRTYQKPGFQPHGLLWWLRPENMRFGLDADLFASWRSTGVPEPWIAKLAPLEGRSFEPKDFHQAIFTAMTGRTDKPTDADLEPYYAMTWKAGRPDASVELGPIRSIVADGYGGQHIAVYPASKLVVVRLREISGPDDAKEPKRFLNEAEGILFPR